MKSRRLIDFLEAGSGVAIVAGLLLMLASGLSVWLGFPMSEPVKGLALNLTWPGDAAVGVSPAGVFLGLAALLAVFAGLGWKKPVLVAWLLAWLLLFYFVWQLTAYDTVWLTEYMQDSVYRGDIQRYNNIFGLLNKGVEPSLTYITEFEHLDDRLHLVWEILGWGWMLGVVGMVVTAIGLRLRRRLPGSGALVALLALATPLCLVLLIGWPTFAGDAAHRRGDVQLARGEAGAALENYRTAFERDPVLALSAPFLDKVSRAALAVYGENDDRVLLALLNQLLVQDALEPAEQLLNTRQAPQGGYFGAAMQARLVVLRAQTYLRRGVNADKKENYPLAIAYYRQALLVEPAQINAQFFLARALLAVRDTGGAMLIAQALPDQVYIASVKADFYSLIGDIHRITGDHNRAREAYAQAYELDNKDNYRPMKELSGT